MRDFPPDGDSTALLLLLTGATLLHAEGVVRMGLIGCTKPIIGKNGFCIPKFFFKKVPPCKSSNCQDGVKDSDIIKIF